MPTLPSALCWQRTDVPGTDLVLFDDRRGLFARGVAAAVAPIPYVCRYELTTDEGWAAQRLEVSTEGAGWLRTARLERAAGRWRVTTAEQGDLDAALRAAGHRGVGLPGIEDPDRLAEVVDVDLGAAPLLNTLPIRRLGLAGAAPGTRHELLVAWVLVPGLEVVVAEQTYEARGAGAVRFVSGDFDAVLSVDPSGYVVEYPGLATRG